MPINVLFMCIHDMRSCIILTMRVTATGRRPSSRKVVCVAIVSMYCWGPVRAFQRTCGYSWTGRFLFPVVHSVPACRGLPGGRQSWISSAAGSEYGAEEPAGDVQTPDEAEEEGSVPVCASVSLSFFVSGVDLLLFGDFVLQCGGLSCPLWPDNGRYQTGRDVANAACGIEVPYLLLHVKNLNAT